MLHEHLFHLNRDTCTSTLPLSLYLAMETRFSSQPFAFRFRCPGNQFRIPFRVCLTEVYDGLRCETSEEGESRFTRTNTDSRICIFLRL